MNDGADPSDPVSSSAEEEATWVDNNRAELIQSISSVMPIADLMLQRHIVHKEMYNNIKMTKTSQDQMREVYSALTSTKAKSAFYNILREIQPEIWTPENITKDAYKEYKENFREKCTLNAELLLKGRTESKTLDQIYTELHVVQGENEHINKQHEIWDIEDKFRTQTVEGTKISCNDIFKSAPGCDETKKRAIRMVMTKGIAGIGKTVSVKKFILDWLDGDANQDLDFIFMFPFRELNLVKDDDFSLETLVKEFYPELKDVAVAKMFANHKILFIFDGLDESQLKLNFKTTKRLTDSTKESSVETLVTNLIREHLLPSALVWITSRPAAIQRIPKQYVYQWTEVRGFDDPQKVEYFRKRVEDKDIAEKIVTSITMSRSLYIMCHIPIFCWIASKVLVHLLLKKGNSQEENLKTPTTLIEMYTHFFCIQMEVATEKYENEDFGDIEKIFESNKEFIFKLGRMAFEKLERGEIVFTSDDLKKYGIDIDKAGVYCGLCTSIFKEESVFHSKKLYCFVHLTVQEYFAGLFVYKSFASKSIESQSLKDFLLKGSEDTLKAILDEDPVDLPLDELMEITIANSTLRKSGELDMFLRFLIGMSLKSTQVLLYGLIQQTEEHSEVVEKIRASLTDIDLLNCSADRCLNLVHCLAELKDSSLYESVSHFVNSNQSPETHLSPVQCSAVADLILMSKTPLEEFNLKKYRPTIKGVFRLLPAVRNCRKVRISGVDLETSLCETISSALRMPHSVLIELHLINCTFNDKGTKILSDGLKNSQCKLEALSFSGDKPTEEVHEKLASAIKGILPNLRELELSGDILMESSFLSVISDGLSCHKLEKLRLNQNCDITNICKQIVTTIVSDSSNLRELELSYTKFTDSEMEILSAALMSTHCTLEALSLSHNNLTAKGCETLASTVVSRPSLRKLDLSYNDLCDAGVMELCNVLRTPFCTLKTLGLSFCKVTVDGCSSLALALTSDHCNLKELDLSFNHLTNEGIKLLTEKQRAPHCSLEYLNVDHNEECWVNLKLLREYACDLTLDTNTAGGNITLSSNNKIATFCPEKQPYPDHPDRFEDAQVLSKEGLTNRHYWEVECHFKTYVGVAYKSIARQGDCTSDHSFQGNDKSWCWSTNGCFFHNGSCERFLVPNTNRVGVYLDWPAGILIFFDVSSGSMSHLYTVRTTFTEPLYPGLSLLSFGKVYLKEINKQ
ncbi:NLR family CARD domain-containing protein 3 isoform X2 [Kryptolebias marmoratus]|uniref:NLR family CARD domain-containing protein 3 isoform X2 n=1 Tax=Kryptolebias marmoratus TaxID=37003 RepID=UPI0007F8AB4B|nr:NLR family CARD domain-containing protein 3 isoform X2 [Kryptolebias marmoratus]XP_017297538.1 NLR family CARD domain-containing protein 3 isoform X2 [Kryptolebias marmoratus]